MLAYAVAAYLEDSGIGTVGSGVFVDTLPDTPVHCTAVFTTGGITFDYSSVLPYDHPTIQIRTRHSSAASGYAIMQDIYSALQGRSSFTLPATPVGDSVFVVGVQALQTEPTNIGRDEDGRAEWTQNYVCIIKRDLPYRN